MANIEAERFFPEASGDEKKYETTFNYLFTHKTLPMSIFRDLDFFYENILPNPQNLQIYLQNVLLTATAWAQKYSPDVEPGYAIERFELGIFGNREENSVIMIDIPNCKEVNDCIRIAIPYVREKAGYFTCELSWSPIDDSKFLIVGEWKPQGEDGNLTHVNYGKLDFENGENFPGRVIKLVYDVDYIIPDAKDIPFKKENFLYEKIRGIAIKGWSAYQSSDLDTALNCFNEIIGSEDKAFPQNKKGAFLFHCRSFIYKARGNEYMADYDMLRAKITDMDDIANDIPLNMEVLKELEFEPREPLIQTEGYYDILQNKDGALLFCIRVREGEPRLSELYYSGGKNGLLRRRIDQYVLLDEIHNEVKEKLSELGSNGGEVLVAEFIPTEEKKELDKDKGIIREYMVPVRRLPDNVSLDSAQEIREDSYPLFASLAELARKQITEGKQIAEIIPKEELPILAAILAREEDYALLEKYIAEGLPLNERCPKHFKSWQPTPLFYITTKKVWPCLKEPKKILRYLVQNGADINLAGAEGDTPLGNQCYSDSNAKILKALLEAGADPNIETVSNDISIKPLILILLPPADYDMETHTFTPHSESVIERAKLLVEFGADVNCIDETVLAPLALAITYSAGILRKELVVFLRNKGAQVDTALKSMNSHGENYPEYYYALYEFYAGFPDLSESDRMPGMTTWKSPGTALRYLQLAAENGYAPAKALLADEEVHPDCLD